MLINQMNLKYYHQKGDSVFSLFLLQATFDDLAVGLDRAYFLFELPFLFSHHFYVALSYFVQNN